MAVGVARGSGPIGAAEFVAVGVVAAVVVVVVAVVVFAVVAAVATRSKRADRKLRSALTDPDAIVRRDAVQRIDGQPLRPYVKQLKQLRDTESDVCVRDALSALVLRSDAVWSPERDLRELAQWAREQAPSDSTVTVSAPSATVEAPAAEVVVDAGAPEAPSQSESLTVKARGATLDVAPSESSAVKPYGHIGRSHLPAAAPDGGFAIQVPMSGRVEARERARSDEGEPELLDDDGNPIIKPYGHIGRAPRRADRTEQLGRRR